MKRYQSTGTLPAHLAEQFSTDSDVILVEHDDPDTVLVCERVTD